MTSRLRTPTLWVEYNRSADMPLSVGDKLGPYEILASIGQGGMGAVYKAKDTRLNRTVAIKVSNQEFTKWFEREAQAVAALNHPNICTLHDVGPNYLVMELIEGTPLKGPLPAEKAVEYAGQILDALDAAHKKGITHRDLKPANIMVTKLGLKLLDFGLAKQAAPLKETDATLTEALTSEGQIVGTLQYMAPEQLQGKEADARSDLFAFGCVLYELISGKPAFGGKSPASIIAFILEREPAPLDIATPLNRVIKTCLAKDPDQRFQNARDLKRNLGWALEQAPFKEAVRRPMLAWIVAGLTALAMVALWAPWRSRRAESDRPLVQLDLDTGNAVSQPAVSPDGLRVVFVANDQLAVRRLDQANTTLLAGTVGGRFPFFSSDGQWVAFFAGGKLLKIAAAGGTPVKLCDAPAGRGGSWGEDGDIIASLNATGGLFRVSGSGGMPRPFTDLKAEAQGVIGQRWPQVLPGGKGLLLTTRFAGAPEYSVAVLPPGGAKSKTLLENSPNGRYMSGYLVYYQRGTLLAAPINLNRLELTGPAMSLVEGVAYDNSHGAAFDTSSSGTLVYRRGLLATNYTVSWLDRSGRTESIMAKPGGYSNPRLSPDGKRLVLSAGPEGQQNLWIYDLTGKSMKKLTFESEGQSYPAWTPDGQFIAFRSGRGLAWIRADGVGKMQALPTGATGDVYLGSFSPDGKWLAFQQGDPQTGEDLWTVAVERTPGTMRLGQPQPLLLQEGQQRQPVISPDGHWVAYYSDETGRDEVYVMSFAPRGPPRGGKWQVSNEGGLEPRWSRSVLFYRSPDGRLMAAAYAAKGDSFAAQEPRAWNDKPLMSTPTNNPASFDVAPDGKRMVGLFAVEESKPDETHLRVLLNVGDELRRRAAAGQAK
jgi:serine/threonine-protein kinase